MNLKKTVLSLCLGTALLASEAMAQGFSEYVTFDWTQFSTNTSYRAQGRQVGFGSLERATYNVTYQLDGRSQSAELSVQRVQRNTISFNFFNRRNNTSCPGSARWQGNAYYGSMSCRSGNHPVTIYL